MIKKKNDKSLLILFKLLSIVFDPMAYKSLESRAFTQKMKTCQ